MEAFFKLLHLRGGAEEAVTSGECDNQTVYLMTL